MTHVIAPRRIFDLLVGLAEHAFFVTAGFVLMVLGTGLSVTMIMLPVGLPLGLLGFAMFVGGMTVRIDRS
jgi:membrane-bound ClpP family serine protease